MSLVYNIDNNSLDLISTGKHIIDYPDFMLVNEHKSIKTGFEDEGLFCHVVTLSAGLAYQRLSDVDDTYEFNLIRPGELSGSKFAKALSGTIIQDSISYDFASLYPPIEFNLSANYINIVTLIVAETKRNTNKQGKLDINILESHTGSILEDSTSYGNLNNKTTNKQNLYIGDIINRDSKYVKFYQNGSASLTLNVFSELIGQDIRLLSFNESENKKTINVNELFNNLNIALSKVSNKNEYNVDIVTDAGISSIASTVDSNNNYDNTITEINNNNNNVTNWISILNTYRQFCEDRKDCIAIVDIPRFVELNGDSPKIRKTNSTNTVTNTIIPILKKLTSGRMSSYITAYTTWLKTLNTFKNVKTWIPPSSKVIGPYVKNDRINGFYLPPANWSLATLDNITELACTLNKKQADLIYSNSYNYIIKNKTNGVTMEGDKTFFKGESIFTSTRNRRIMNKINTYVNDIALRYIMEGNNDFIRSKLKSKIESILKLLKHRAIIFDYGVKCDAENNPPIVIDNKELRVSVRIKFTSNVEFILADFILTATNTDFKTVLKLY